MARTFLFPWKMGGASARLLAEALGIKRVYPDGKYKPRKGDTIINWGNAGSPDWYADAIMSDVPILNYPHHVNTATNKLLAFTLMEQANVRVPLFTPDKDMAVAWLEDGPVVARYKLSGHSADGLLIVTDPDNIGNAPLYTKYRKKAQEYRVHVFNGIVMDIAQKKLRQGLDKQHVDYKVRNWSGGWIYARAEIDPPNDVFVQALKAVEALHLDFGAVDIGWNELKQEATVYEVNTAPGLTGTTLWKYARTFSQACGTELKIEKPDHEFEFANAYHPMEDVEDGAEVHVNPFAG